MKWKGAVDYPLPRNIHQLVHMAHDPGVFEEGHHNIREKPLSMEKLNEMVARRAKMNQYEYITSTLSLALRFPLGLYQVRNKEIAHFRQQKIKEWNKKTEAKKKGIKAKKAKSQRKSK